MKTLLMLLLCTNGLVGTLSAASQETNGKLKLGDPIPAVSSTDQDGKAVDLAQVAKPATHWSIFIRKP